MRPRSAVSLLDRGDAGQTGAVIAKMTSFAALSQTDRDAVAALCWNTRRVEPHHDLISEGDRPSSVHVILEGWACRYTTLSGGDRHIHAVLMPGDFCDGRATILDRMDHSIAAVTRIRVASVSPAKLAALGDAHPAIGEALHWSTLVDLAVMRQWMVGLGRRSALSRIAHLLCELRDRSLRIGIGDAGGFPLPLSQVEMADALGLTPVHTNRVLSDLRRSDIAMVRSGTATIMNADALERAGDYDPGYLRLRAMQQAA